jgi:hypothetical protein
MDPWDELTSIAVVGRFNLHEVKREYNQFRKARPLNDYDNVIVIKQPTNASRR